MPISLIHAEIPTKLLMPTWKLERANRKTRAKNISIKHVFLETNSIKLIENKQHRYRVLLFIFSLDCYGLDNRTGDESS